MITAQVEKWLSDAGLFQLVTNAPSKVLPDFFLEGAISSLYGDFRDIKQPRAVIELHFFMIEAGKSKANVILQKRYRREIPMAGSTADHLIEGWTTGLRDILTDFEAVILAAGLCDSMEKPDPKDKQNTKILPQNIKNKSPVNKKIPSKTK
jgi:cholesterol transport system auxiliary component